MSPKKPEASYPVDEVWYAGEYPAWIDQTAESLNQEDYDELTVGLGSKVVQLTNGITYARLGEGASESEALVMFCPFANDVADNMLIRGEFVRRVAEASGVKDSEGKPLQLIVFGSPSGSQGLKLSKSQASELKNDLGYFAGEHMKVVRELGFKKVGLLGFSQGAAVALEAAIQANEINLEVGSLAIGDPPNVKARSVMEIAKNFMAENAYLRDDVMASGIDANIRAHKMDKTGFLAAVTGMSELLKYGIAIFRRGRANLGLAHALATDNFTKKSENFLRKNPEAKYVVGFGTASSITPSTDIKDATRGIKNHFGIDSMELVAIDGGHHSWGDNLPLLAKFFVGSLIK